MKLQIFTIFILIISVNSFGQSLNPPENAEQHTFGLTPVEKHTIINGVAVGLSAHPWSTWGDTVYMKVNGLNLEVGPLGIVGGIWGPMYGLLSFAGGNKSPYSFFSNSAYPDSLHATTYPKFGTHLNGVSLSLGGVTDSYNNGLFINGLSCFCHKTFGVQFSGLVNNTYEFKGMSIAGIANVTNIGHGVQIGLINKCNTGNLVQIGLWNRIGKRVFPFINFRISSK